MEKEREELIETFRRLDPVNRADLLAHVRVAYAAQENTKRWYGIAEPEVPPVRARHGSAAPVLA
jgi:hypothetical protein